MRRVPTPVPEIVEPLEPVESKPPLVSVSRLAFKASVLPLSIFNELWVWLPPKFRLAVILVLRASAVAASTISV